MEEGHIMAISSILENGWSIFKDITPSIMILIRVKLGNLKLINYAERRVILSLHWIREGVRRLVLYISVFIVCELLTFSLALCP